MESGLIPIFYHEDPSIARQIVDACAAGGATLVEFTNRGDRAWQTFSALCQHRLQGQTAIMLGAGSIMDPATAALFINCGADFIVGPAFDATIAELCNRRKVAYIPGCATLTEIATAEASGVEFVKIFPGQVLGPAFLKAVHGPQPWTNMIVTGGVLPDEANIRQWFDAGACAVGMGSGLIRHDWVLSAQMHKITESVSRVAGWIAAQKHAHRVQRPLDAQA